MQQGPRHRFSVRSGGLSVHPPLQARVKHIGNSVSFTQTYTKLPCCHNFVVKNLETLVFPVPASVWNRNISPGLNLFPPSLSSPFHNTSTIIDILRAVKYVVVSVRRNIFLKLGNGSFLYFLWEMRDDTRSLQYNILVFRHSYLRVYMCTHNLFLHYQGAAMDLI